MQHLHADVDLDTSGLLRTESHGLPDCQGRSVCFTGSRVMPVAACAVVQGTFGFAFISKRWCALCPLCRVADEDACLAKCAADEDCNCALFKGGTCTELWTTCDSAVLSLKPSSSGSVALKPCTSLPLTPKKATASSKRALCNGLCCMHKTKPGH